MSQPTAESVLAAVDDCLDRIAAQAARREVDDVVTSRDVLAAVVDALGITEDTVDTITMTGLGVVIYKHPPEVLAQLLRALLVASGRTRRLGNETTTGGRRERPHE